MIHIESPVQRQFSLGEFFSEWAVSLRPTTSARCTQPTARPCGHMSTAHCVLVTRPPITFAPHDQIAVIYGVPQAGETIPAHFDFPRGD